QRLGLHDLPIIGLAKEHEEIYRPDRALPLHLPMDSGSLRLLQRIRDEAHRFANAYHQLLMKKRIGESLLDDCPGISQNRKNLLLRKFGSVNQLRKAKGKQSSLPSRRKNWHARTSLMFRRRAAKSRTATVCRLPKIDSATT